MNKLQSQMKRFMLERGWEKQLPADMAKSIVIEAAELLELFQWNNPSTAQLINNSNKIADVRDELADVITYSLAMAILIGADVDEIVTNKLSIVARKYPAKIMGKSPYDSDTQDIYLKIKRNHRKIR